MNRISFFFLILLIFSSCKQVDNPKTQFQKWVKKGTVIEKVVCKDDPTQSYCLYLPTHYDVSINYPTIYVFDPHGNGHLPVELMKKVAEKLGCIVIGSNNSRNGISSVEINSIVSALFVDTQQKLSIDPKKIFLAGFSGGARIACSLAQSIRGIRGVISCSAGFQPQNNSIGFHFIGIAGTQDMNYLEVKQVDAILKKNNFPSSFLFFKGKHQWPTESILNEAITMLDIQTMKELNAPSSKNIIDEYYNNATSKLKTLTSSNNPDSLYKAFTITERTLTTLIGLRNIDEINAIQSEISLNPVFRKHQIQMEEVEKYEFEKQQEFTEAFDSKTDSWWKKEVDKLNNSAEGFMLDVSQRLLGFVSLNCYGYVNGALQQRNWKAAEHYIYLYRLVDPENPDCWYANACLKANSGKLDEAIMSLKQAIKFGYTNYTKLKNDPLLSSLQNNVEFEKLLNR